MELYKLCLSCQEISAETCTFMHQCQWKVLNSALIRSFGALAPSLLRLVISHRNISDSILLEMILDVFENWHPFCSRQYTQNIIADDQVIASFVPTGPRSIVGVVVIPLFGIDVTTTPAAVIQHLNSWARCYQSMLQEPLSWLRQVLADDSRKM